MSDLPKTREYNTSRNASVRWWTNRRMAVPEGCAKVRIEVSDAMRGELLARIAELEAELAMKDKMLRLFNCYADVPEYALWLTDLRRRAR